MRSAGFVLLAIGIVLFLVRGFNFTTEEKIIDAGPIEVSKKEGHYAGWPLYAGGIAAVAGVVLIVVGGRKR